MPFTNAKETKGSVLFLMVEPPRKVRKEGSFQQTGCTPPTSYNGVPRSLINWLLFSKIFRYFHCFIQ